jgi:hypothetical protein
MRCERETDKDTTSTSSDASKSSIVSGFSVLREDQHKGLASRDGQRQLERERQADRQREGQRDGEGRCQDTLFCKIGVLPGGSRFPLVWILDVKVAVGQRTV